MPSISSALGQVAVGIGFLTRDPSLIWNTVRHLKSENFHIQFPLFKLVLADSQYIELSKITNFFHLLTTPTCWKALEFGIFE